MLVDEKESFCEGILRWKYFVVEIFGDWIGNFPDNGCMD